MKFKRLAALIFIVAIAASAAQAAQKSVKRASAAKTTAKTEARQDARSQEEKEAAVPRMTVDELILKLSKKAPITIIDVRNPDSYETKIKGALQIPHAEVEAHLKEIPRNKPIVTYCS